jgi:hypothetical protein
LNLFVVVVCLFVCLSDGFSKVFQAQVPSLTARCFPA